MTARLRHSDLLRYIPENKSSPRVVKGKKVKVKQSHYRPRQALRFPED
jgi:hypothetical protein